MVAFLAGLLKNWKIGALLSVVSGVSATIYIQHLEIDHAKTQLAAAKAQYQLLQRSNLEMQEAVRRQNDAVAALSAQYQLRQRRTAEWAEKAQKQAARYRQAAKLTARFGTQRKDKDECMALRAIIDAYTEMASKEKF